MHSHRNRQRETISLTYALNDMETARQLQLSRTILTWLNSQYVLSKYLLGPGTPAVNAHCIAFIAHTQISMSQKVSLFSFGLSELYAISSPILSIGARNRKTKITKKEKQKFNCYWRLSINVCLHENWHFIDPFCWHKIECIRSMFEIKFEWEQRSEFVNWCSPWNGVALIAISKWTISI